MDNADFRSTLAIYHKWVNENQTSENKNIRAVACMLDTNQWNGYAGDNAEYAIGGPTIEMFCTSYNQTHAIGIDYIWSSLNGYNIKLTNDTEYSNRVTGIDTSENIYVIESIERTDEMWLASPSGNVDDNYLLGVYYNGNIAISSLEYTDCVLGFRPIVCLKSNVQLIDAGDGTYQIK